MYTNVGQLEQMYTSVYIKKTLVPICIFFFGLYTRSI